MDIPKKKVLDVGCGRNKIKDSIGIDLDKNSLADITHDLNVYPYPFEDNSFDEIYAKHIIEHVENPRKFIKELFRILKQGGTVFIETPHFSSRVAYSEPDHKRFFSYFMFSNLINGIDAEVISQKITFYKSFRNSGIAYLANKSPDSYERFWTYIFPAENVTLLAKKK